MTEYLNDYKVPEIGQVINMPPEVGGTAIVVGLEMPQSQGYFAVATDTGYVVDTVYDTNEDSPTYQQWNSRKHKAIIYPDLGGWVKGL